MVEERKRDYQRSKVYASERKHPLWETQYVEMPEIKELAAKYGVTVRPGKGARWCRGSYDFRKITMPRWGRFKLVVCHELAHTVTPNKYAAHGPEFCSNFLYIVLDIMGSEAADLLERCFKRDEVDFLPNWYLTGKCDYFHAGEPLVPVELKDDYKMPSMATLLKRYC